MANTQTRTAWSIFQASRIDQNKSVCSITKFHLLNKLLRFIKALVILIHAVKTDPGKKVVAFICARNIDL